MGCRCIKRCRPEISRILIANVGGDNTHCGTTAGPSARSSPSPRLSPGRGPTITNRANAAPSFPLKTNAEVRVRVTLPFIGPEVLANNSSITTPTVDGRRVCLYHSNGIQNTAAANLVGCIALGWLLVKDMPVSDERW